MPSDRTDPLIDSVDRTHQRCLEARADIRAQVAWLKAQVAVWEPRPVPSKFAARAATNKREE